MKKDKFYEITNALREGQNTPTEVLHTQGEWTLRKTSTGWIVEAIGKPVEMFTATTYEKAEDFIPTILIYQTDSVSPEETANAKLIASAPKLLEENKRLLEENQILKNDILNGLRIEKVLVDSNRELVSILESNNAVISECYGYFSASNFTDRYGTADRLKDAHTTAKQAIEGNSIK